MSSSSSLCCWGVLGAVVAVAGLMAINAATPSSLPLDAAPGSGGSLEPVLQWARSGHYFNYNGHAIFYKTSVEPGKLQQQSSQAQEERPVLVMLHGFPTSSYDWEQVWDPLQSQGGFDLVALDFIGFGLSDKPRPFNYTLVEQADIVEALLSYLGVHTFHVLSHDYGDSVAQELLVRANERAATDGTGMQSLVLLNGGILPGMHRPMVIQWVMASAWAGPLLRLGVCRPIYARSLSKVFGPTTQPTTEEMDAYWGLTAHKGGHLNSDLLLRYMPEREVHKQRWEGALRDSVVPLVFIDGPSDIVSGVHLVEPFRALVASGSAAQHASAVVLDAHVGHYPQVEDPKAVLAAMFEFYAKYLK